MYCYRTDHQEGLCIVGFYDPSCRWIPESDHVEISDAAARVNYLNGGIDLELFYKAGHRVCGLLARTNYLLEELGKRLDHDKN